MKQLNTTQANTINAAVANFFNKSVAYDEAREQLTNAMRQAKLTREQIRPAVVAYVCQRTPGAMFDADKQTLVNNRDHANAKVRKAYEAAKRQISRILATAEGKPRATSNKVDPVEKLMREFRSLSKAQQRRFMESI